MEWSIIEPKGGAKVIISDEQDPAGGSPVTVAAADRYTPTENGYSFAIAYLTQAGHFYEISAS
jgi:hypothetical protein